MRTAARWALACIGGLLLLILMAALGGCTTTPKYVQVSVPVPVECKETKPARPAMPTEGLRPGGTLFAGVKAMQAEIEIREGYEGRLVAALDACLKPVQSPQPAPRP